MARRRIARTVSLLALIVAFIATAPLHAQAPRPTSFLASHYDVSATLDAIGQSLSATAKIEFTAVEASSSVRVELHPNLIVKEVKAENGKPLAFQRDDQNHLYLNVQLLTPVATGGHVTLSFTYEEWLFNEENTPSPSAPSPSINI